MTKASNAPRLAFRPIVGTTKNKDTIERIMKPLLLATLNIPDRYATAITPPAAMTAPNLLALVQ